MVDSLQRAYIATVKDDFALQFVPILLDVVVLHHDNHHICLVEELVEIRVLVGGNLLVLKEGVVTM